MSAPIRYAVIAAVHAPETIPKERRYPCKPSCCRNPYFCAKGRKCACHQMEEAE